MATIGLSLAQKSTMTLTLDSDVYVRFNYSAVPEDGDLRTGYGPSIWLCLRATIAAYAAQKDGDLAGEDFREHTATKE